MNYFWAGVIAFAISIIGGLTVLFGSASFVWLMDRRDKKRMSKR